MKGKITLLSVVKGILCRLFKSKEKVGTTHQGDEHKKSQDNKTIEDNSEGKGENNKIEGTETDKNLPNTENDARKVNDEIEKALDEQISTIIEGYENDVFEYCNDRYSKVLRLRSVLSENINLTYDIKRIAKELCGNENSDTQTLLKEIKKLKSEKTDIESNKDSKDNKTIAASEFERLIKSHKISKAIYNEETNGGFEARVKQLLDKLCRKIEISIDTTSIDGRPKAEQYVIEQLKLNGLGNYFDSNTTLESGLNNIKEDVKKGQSSAMKGEPVNTSASAADHPSDFESLVKALHSKLPEIPDNISSPEELVEAIKGLLNDNQSAASSVVNTDEIKAQVFNSIKDLLESKGIAKNIIVDCQTTEDIVKKLSEAFEEADFEKQRLEEEQKNTANKIAEAYAKVGGEDKLADSDLNGMLAAYSTAVYQKSKKDEDAINALRQENSDKQEVIESNNKTFSEMLSDMKEVMKQDIDEIQSSISGSFIRPCDMNLKSQCDDNQSLLRDAFNKFSKKLQAAEAIGDYAELYKDVQKAIEEDIANEYGLTNVLSRYYAYSCLPFMTDQAREYGMRIDHERMMRAYNALAHFVNRFGLQLIVPNLFADRIGDGEYEDCTGEKYGDLENMCPGKANYVLEISNSDKQHYVTDLVWVGYKKDNEVKQKAMVLVA